MNQEVTFFFVVLVLFVILLFWIFILKPEIDSFYLLKIKNYRLKFELFMLEKNLDKNDQAYINTLKLFYYYTNNINSFSLSSILAFRRFRKEYKDDTIRMINIENLKYITPNKDLYDEISLYRKKLRNLFLSHCSMNLFFIFLMSILIICLYVLSLFVAICKKIILRRKFSFKFKGEYILKKLIPALNT